MSATLFPTHPDPIRHWRRLTPDRIALVDRVRGDRLTYAELDAGADRWAAALASLGVGPGDLVAVLASNRREQVELFFACGRLGAALVPLNWRLAPAELGPILADARPRVLLGDSRFRAAAEAAAPLPHSAVWLDLDADAPRLLGRAGAPPEDRAVGPDDPALVLYTSGSTGRPKGAVLPHRQLVWNAVATTTSWELGPTDVAPISTPLFHTGGWNVFATPLWHRGGTVVLLDAFDPAAFLDVMAEEGCTFALTVPTQLMMLLQAPSWGRPLPALRSFMSGGAPLPPALAERVRASGYRLREGYGLTECGPNCFASTDEASLRRPGSVGWPIAHLSMRLVTEDGREAEVGEPGELLLRGPQRFAGYLRDPARTAEALTPDGWLRTGDLARRDADGAFYICGRRKEMFISGGENVFPGEVEAALADCEGVLEVAVIGVPDALWGEVGRAFVVRRPGTTLTAADVVAHVRARLAAYKAPKSVVFVDAIPRLGSGKVDRPALATLTPPEA
ncbi:MAG: AMP-binding protein [Gemmatimonadetes bacterium]|nr:AMP-binding protein [Gemmatimonadota bacterium]